MNNDDIITLSENNNKQNFQSNHHQRLSKDNLVHYINEKITNSEETNIRQKNKSSQNSNDNPSCNFCVKNKKCILIILLISFVVIIGTIVTLVLVLKKKDEPEEPINHPEHPEEPNPIEEPIKPPEPYNENISTPINPIPSDKKKIESEFSFKLDVKELKSVSVEQKFTENVTSNDKVSTLNILRKTNYELFVQSEEKPDEENINFFDKKYTVAILINSQCYSTNEETCTPKKMIELKNIKSDDVENSLRHLDEKTDLKDLPIPLCLFNLTDNDVITSITCPKNLQKNIIQNMILDMYFFRPPAIKRDKIKTNVTINKWKENDTYYIREINGGICDVSDPFNSFCTTDMNTTLDLEGNLLTYDEVATTYIINDINNSFYKIKTTNLRDNSKDVENVNKTTYEQFLNKLISILSPNMIYKEEFSTEEFKKLYQYSKNITNKKDSNRNLDDKNKEKATLVYEKILFNIKNKENVKILYTLKNDLGLNTESIKAFSFIKIDESNHETSNLKKFSNIGEVLQELINLSESGNELLLELYDKIKECFENISKTISNNITDLINIIAYNDLSEIFDSTLSIENLMILPISILVESQSLKSNLQTVFNNIDNGGMKNNIKILNSDINNYIQKSHILVDNIFKNIQNLTKSLNSSKSKLTEISTYFLDNTPSSFLGTINEASEILMNYYKNEKELILEKIKEPLNMFESGVIESIKKEEKIINNLLSKLDNEQISITNGIEEDYRNLKLNLYNSKKYILEIIEKGKEKIENEMNLKNSGYFISNYDLESNNNSYYQAKEIAIQIATKLDDDEFIDKFFCEKMSDFKENYTNICKYMDKIKKEKFPINDDVLNTSIFTVSVKQSFDFDNLGISIYNSIINENDKYLNNVSKIVNDFLNENKNELDELFLNLTLLFSEDSLENLVDNFKNDFDYALDKIKSDIQTNKKLSEVYFEKIKNITEYDNSYIIEILKTYLTDNEHMPYISWIDPKNSSHYVYLKKFVDSISSKGITQGYLSKYQYYKNNIQDSYNYVNNTLFLDLKNEYKNQLIKLRECLQKLKKSRISDIYPDLPELNFIDKNINQLNEFFTRLNKYISDDEFNNYYLPKINEFINNQSNEVINIDTNVIEYYHNIISENSPKIMNDYQNDFCLYFLRKKTYTCTNGNIADYEETLYYCFPLDEDSDNHKKLLKTSSDSKPKFSIFNEKLNNLLSDLNIIIDSYNSKIENLKKNLSDLKENVLQDNNVNETLQNISNKFEEILNNYFGEKLIKSSHNYFKQKTNEQMTTVLDDVYNNWNDLFSSLKTEVESNKDIFKNSLKEFGLMAKLIQQVFIKNITNSFYNSIISHQKKEYNYSISYYYNYLHKTLNSTYQLILSKIPQNKAGLDEIIKVREGVVNSVFSNIFQMLVDSKNLALDLNTQIYTLQIPETNFFQTNTILTNFQKNINSSLTTISNEIYGLDNGKKNDEYALTLKYYLENSENGKQINDFYEEINNQVFIYLNLEKFKQTILNNWILDQDDFIKKLNHTLYISNAQISKLFEINVNEYKTFLENLITQYFTKEEIVHKINELYSNAYNHLEENEIKEINENVQEIINKVKEHLISEENKIETSLVSFNKNFSQINHTINEYKNTIFSTLNKTIFNVLDEIYSNIYSKVYTNYVEFYLNDYYENISESIKDYKTSKLLNSSYNLKETIHDIITELYNQYNYITKNQIINKYKDYYEKIYEELNLNSVRENINQQIETQFNNFYVVLEKNAIYDVGENVTYDFSNEIKKEIDEFLQNKTEDINETVQNTKGDNFEIDIRNWKIPDFSRLNDNVSSIKSSFDTFINQQKINEHTDINEFLQKIIKSNFNDLLYNLIPSFGNDFFDRIIFYNKNFKIESLYNNLRWGLTESLSYYISLFSLNPIKTLTKDLKLKIFSLNDLDKVIKKRNKEILDLLEVKINEFIEDSKNVLIENYTSLLKDVSVKSAFNADIQKKIDDNLNLIVYDLHEEYNSLLKNYFTDKIINSYTQVLNDLSDEMVDTVKEQREFIKVKLDDVFSIDPDDVLNDINNKLSSTQKAIKDYNDFFNTFNISQDLLAFVDNFGNNKISPCFKHFVNLLNQITKNQIYENINKNSEDYEKNYEKENILEFINNSFNKVKNEYIEIMNDSIHSYGIENYKKNLEKKIDGARRRRLQNNNTVSLYSKNVADKSIDETFHNLLNNSQNLKSFIKNYDFDKFDEKIKINIEKLNSKYKYSKNLIDNFNYEEEIFNYISNKLESLNNLTNDYYTQVNESFYQLRFYFDTSIEEIDNLLNLCANETFSTFKEKYEEISQLNISQSIDSEQEEDKKEVFQSDDSKYQNGQNEINFYMENLQKKAKFKFEFNFEEINNLKMPKVYAHVINLSRPKILNINITKSTGVCGKKIESYEIEFNNVNFSMFLDFTTDSTDIISTIITNFDAYQYTKTLYTVEESFDDKCVDLKGLGMDDLCVDNCEASSIIEEGREVISVEKKYSKEIVPIPN